jgi:hypothetical protein
MRGREIIVVGQEKNRAGLPEFSGDLCHRKGGCDVVLDIGGGVIGPEGGAEGPHPHSGEHYGIGLGGLANVKRLSWHQASGIV